MERRLVGYGTLMKKDSLGVTIGGTAAQTKTLIPVTVRGYRRLFNLRPAHYQSSATLSTKGNEVGGANVIQDDASLLNAVAFNVSDEELRCLDARELDYYRISVPIYSFPLDEQIGTGEIYITAKDHPRLLTDIEQLLPRWYDLQVARTSSYEFHPDFGRMYDKTTFLADGRTLAIELYREHFAKSPEEAKCP